MIEFDPIDEFASPASRLSNDSFLVYSRGTPVFDDDLSSDNVHVHVTPLCRVDDRRPRVVKRYELRLRGVNHENVGKLSHIKNAGLDAMCRGTAPQFPLR